MSGFVLAESILTGILQDRKTPVVRFQLTSGDQPHPMFILRVNLAVEMYAWYVTMQKHLVEKVYVATTASMVSDGDRSIMVANSIEFHTSNPNVRVEVEQCCQDMMSGRWPHGWPGEVIQLPIKSLEKEERAVE
jgi:hypothetical protein